eukprot:m.216175 g.216175  ORF g.216175 m.216175 type:complete len:122 (-) comp33203_c1_seq1:704-1069(-)
MVDALVNKCVRVCVHTGSWIPARNVAESMLRYSEAHVKACSAVEYRTINGCGMRTPCNKDIVTTILQHGVKSKMVVSLIRHPSKSTTGSGSTTTVLQLQHHNNTRLLIEHARMSYCLEVSR